MPTYAIGDIQGCFAELKTLLAHIHFDPLVDTLWFTGDLVNRGPQSLEVLRFVKALGDQHHTVLGNHDLHLLALSFDVEKQEQGDTLAAILTAPDRNELIDWLRHRPLLHIDNQLGYVMAHAGVNPFWTIKQAQSLAQEVETELQSASPLFFLNNMLGNQPDRWEENLSGMERLRCIVNYFTRMRFCDAAGRLNFLYKGKISSQPDNLLPWFMVPGRVNKNDKIIFGHWAALNGNATVPHIYELDTGCVWGNCLTAMRLEDEKRFSVKCGKIPLA